MEHLLLQDKTLAKSNPSQVSKEILDLLQTTKEQVEQRKEEWYKIAVLHITADLLHCGHVSYIQEVNRKLREFLQTPYKLLVWVESDIVSKYRKDKINIYNDEERLYIMDNIKWVDKAFISFSNATENSKEDRPYWVTKYLEPDVLVSHEEYFPTQELEEETKSKMQEIWGDFLCIKESERLELSIRDRIWRSTTSTIKQILETYKDHPKYKSFISSENNA